MFSSFYRGRAAAAVVETRNRKTGLVITNMKGLPHEGLISFLSPDRANNQHAHCSREGEGANETTIIRRRPSNACHNFQLRHPYGEVEY